MKPIFNNKQSTGSVMWVLHVKNDHPCKLGNSAMRDPPIDRDFFSLN